MGAGGARHKRLKRLSSKQRRVRPNKRFKMLVREMTDQDEVNPVEPTYNLLLASLRFWEVERDLIDERKAVIDR